MRDRIKYSQNFLADPELVKALINKSSITTNDIVYEIGAGEGIITKQLLLKAKKVIAFELDRNFFGILDRKFEGKISVELKLADFLNSALPNYPYKVFSNIPFNITSAIIKKLTLESYPPEDAYLIIQKEAAMKFAGKPLDNKNSQLSVILNPWFEFTIKHRFKPDDFNPRPNVDIVLLEIKKRSEPLVEDKNRYEDFVTYAFNQTKPNIVEGLSKIIAKQHVVNLTKTVGFTLDSKPSELDFKDWVSLFNLFLTMTDQQQIIVKGSFAKQLKQQENIERVHRTRTDESWKKYEHQ